jgi:hypothetical protein
MPNNTSNNAKSPTKGDDILDKEFRKSYFTQLVGQFTTLGNEVKNDEARSLGQRIVSMDPDKVEWDDIYQLELSIIKLEPEVQARRRVWALRSEYQNVAPKDYEHYAKSNPPDPDKDPIDKVRADSVRIQEELNWYYTVLWVQETFRSLLLKRITKRTLCYFAGYVAFGLILMALGFLGGFLNLTGKANAETGGGTNLTLVATNVVPGNTNLTALLIVTNQSAEHPSAPDTAQAKDKTTPIERAMSTVKEALPVFGAYWLVVFAGTLGALVSILRRIQNMTLDGNSDTNLVELERNSSSITYSPLLGAVFALLLLFLFMSGLLSGALFPKASDSHTRIFLGCVPSTCVELAKLIVWSFIAGFAEKFVPDALDKLQKESSSQKPAATT